MHQVKRKDNKQAYAAGFYKIPFSVMSLKDELGIKREIEILQIVNHPFVIKYIEDFEYKPTNRLCIITEFIAGGDFERYIRGNSGFTE